MLLQLFETRARVFVIAALCLVAAATAATMWSSHVESSSLTASADLARLSGELDDAQAKREELQSAPEVKFDAAKLSLRLKQAEPASIQQQLTRRAAADRSARTLRAEAAKLRTQLGRAN